MAHEELKALYEIDKQNSDDPDQYWEFKSISGDWIACYGTTFCAGTEYRRKPGAPVWPVSDDAEDARKWRELDEYLPTALNANAVMGKITELKSGKPPLIQGYTAEQWQVIIDGKFLCEFSDADWHIENNYADRIVRVLTGITDGRFTGNDYHWPYCRPLRIKGVRQPWFGGECPVTKDSMVLVKLRSGQIYGDCKASELFWNHNQGPSDIVGFIEL